MICHFFYCFSYCLGSGLQTNDELSLDQLSNRHEIVDEIASKSAKKYRMIVLRTRFLLTTRDDLTGEYDIGL